MSAAPLTRVLVADADYCLLTAVGDALRRANLDVIAASTRIDAMRLLREEPPALAVVSTNIERLVTEVRAHAPTLPLITLIERSHPANQSKSVEAGALAAFPRQRLEIGKLVEACLKAAAVRVTARSPTTTAADLMIGGCKAMTDVQYLIDRFAPRRAPVLIVGESGTGKELVARALHRRSGRDGMFAAVNCAALPGELLESEMFGHVKGAFTGAYADKKGLFEAAMGGTVFLDEISAMPLPLQSRLLRFLQDHVVRRVGSNEYKTIDVRVVAASNRDLECLVEERAFREDLFHRLNVLPIEMPPLRERKSDIGALAQHFIEVRCREDGVTAPTLSADVVALLEAYRWPGNVRELESVVERALALMTDGKLQREHLPPRLFEDPVPEAITEVQPLAEYVREYVHRVVRFCNGNRKDAAQRLAISTVTLRKMLRQPQRRAA